MSKIPGEMKHAINARLNRIMAWAVLLDALDRSGGDDIVIPIHTLGEIGRSITSDALFVMERLEDLEVK